MTENANHVEQLQDIEARLQLIKMVQEEKDKTIMTLQKALSEVVNLQVKVAKAGIGDFKIEEFEASESTFIHRNFRNSLARK